MNIPKLRFKGFSEEWDKVKLLNISKLKTGNKNSEDNIKNGKYVFFDRSNEIKHLNTFSYDEETIIYPGEGSNFQPIYFYGKYSLHQRAYSLYSFDNSINTKYLYYYLLTQGNVFLKYSVGTTVSSLRRNTFEKVMISTPSIKEQQKIGALFAKLDNLINLQVKKLELLKQLKQGLLQKLFPQKKQTTPQLRFKGFNDAWKHCTFGDIGTIAMNKRIFKNQTSEHGDIPFYKIGTFGKKADAFISKDLFEKYKKLYPYPRVGNVLISASGTIGRTIVYNGEQAYYQDSNIVWLDTNSNEIDDKFLIYVYQVVKWNGIEGTTIKRLYNKNILNTKINIPNIQEQQKIGSLLANLDKLLTKTQEKITLFKQVKKYLLQRMFI